MNPPEDSRLRFTHELEERKMRFLEELTPSHPMDVARRLSLISALAHSTRHPMKFDCGCEECDARLRGGAKKGPPPQRHPFEDTNETDDDDTSSKHKKSDYGKEQRHEIYSDDGDDDVLDEDEEDEETLSEQRIMSSTHRPEWHASPPPHRERMPVEAIVEIDLDTPRATTHHQRKNKEVESNEEEDDDEQHRKSDARFISTSREPSAGGYRVLPLTGSRSRSSVESDSETMMSTAVVVHPEGTTLVYHSMHSKLEGKLGGAIPADDSDDDERSDTGHKTPNARAAFNTSSTSNANRMGVECEMSPFLISPDPKGDLEENGVELTLLRRRSHISARRGEAAAPFRALQSPPPPPPPPARKILSAKRVSLEDPFSAQHPQQQQQHPQQQHLNYRPKLQPEPFHPAQYSRSPPQREYMSSQTLSQDSHRHANTVSEGLSRSLNRLRSDRTSCRGTSSTSGRDGEGSYSSAAHRSSRVPTEVTRPTSSSSSSSDYRAIYPVHRPARLAERFVEIAYHEHSHPYCLPETKRDEQIPSKSNNSSNSTSKSSYRRSDVSERVLDASAIERSVDSVSRATWIVDTFSPMEAEHESVRPRSESTNSSHASLSQKPFSPEQEIKTEKKRVEVHHAPTHHSQSQSAQTVETRGNSIQHTIECSSLKEKAVKPDAHNNKTGAPHWTQSSATTGSGNSPWVQMTNPLRYLNEGTILSPHEKKARPQPTSTAAPLPRVVDDPRTYLNELHRHNAERWKYTTVSHVYPRCSTWRIDSFL